MASVWNLCVWLKCIGVVSGCCCWRYIDFLIILLIATPLVLALFCSSITTFMFIFKVFFMHIVVDIIVTVSA